MVSRPTRFTIPRFITSDVIKRTVHRPCPSGGGPQTSATIAASSTLSSIRSAPGRGSSASADVRPAELYRSATRFTSRWYPPTAFAVASTDKPLSRCSSVRIRRHVRADNFSPAFSFFNSSRSAGLSFRRGGRAGLSFTLTLRSEMDPVSKTHQIRTPRSEH